MTVEYGDDTYARCANIFLAALMDRITKGKAADAKKLRRVLTAIKDACEVAADDPPEYEAGSPLYTAADGNEVNAFWVAVEIADRLLKEVPS